jgi:uncharacterized protein
MTPSDVARRGVVANVVAWITSAEDRILDALRSAQALSAATDEPTGDISSLRGHRHCLLITYRRDGTPVPSPLWFAEHDGKLYVHTGGWKAKRIANNPLVRVAPCDFRGRPFGPPFQATARALSAAERATGQAILDAKNRITQRLYYRTLGRGQHSLAEVIEITPLIREATP